MKYLSKQSCTAILLAAALTSCATRSVQDSRQALWNRFGNRSVDDVVLAWGAPQSETRLTNGTRVLTYRRTRTYFRDFAPDYMSYGDSVECDASFLARPPDFRIAEVSLDGDIFQCADMANGPSGPASPNPGL